MTLTAWTDITNQSLLRIGGAPITTWPIVTPANREERLIKTYWTATIEEVARDHEWMDLYAQAKVEVTDPGATDYQSQTGESVANLATLKAAGLIKVRDVYPAQPWRIENSKLYLQEGGTIIDEVSGSPTEGDPIIWVRYTKIPVDFTGTTYTTITDALLIEALALKLAQKICYGLNAQAGLEAKLIQEYMAKLGEARARDIQDQRDYERPDYKEAVEIWGFV
jgi:hypothetical protein